MARKSPLRVRVDDAGMLEIIDPGFDTLPLLTHIDPGFAPATAGLPGFVAPRFQRARRTQAAVAGSEITGLSLSQLWALHDNTDAGQPEGCGVSLLDLKARIARGSLESCRLCARLCGVNRLAGRRGPCLLGREALVADHFVHVAEEPFVNPSLVVSLAGCALRCRFCQQSQLLTPNAAVHEPLTGGLWQQLEFAGARSLSFIGGNPDESLPAILEFLLAAPSDFALPIVWNNHAYMSDETLRLLSGIVDCYTPDLKFMTASCARAIAGIDRYPDIAMASIDRLLLDGVPVIVRILMLPGHNECCHGPAVRWLSGRRECENLWVSVRGQYSPDWKIRGGPLARRPRLAEVGAVTKLASDLGLRIV